MDAKMDEKYRLPLQDGAKKTTVRSYRTLLWRTLLVVESLVLGKLFLSPLVARHALPPTQVHLEPENPELIWNGIPSSGVDSLLWMSCYTDKLCARLMVPLDYAVPDGPKAGIAIVKVPSKFSPGNKDYRGPILFNPGGPGLSGVSLVVDQGANFQKVIGDEYDIVGFDPRGVERTTPQVIVFPDAAEDAAWRIRVQDDPSPNSTLDAVSRLWARAQVFGSVANITAANTAPYISTTLVARDMLSIVRAHGHEKIQYWGFSYGAILGSTFAAMFPNNVGRLLIDGGMDVEDVGLWSNNLLDTDKALRMILDACVAAGPSLCGLHESTTDKVHARLTAIYDTLKESPLPVHNNITSREYGLVDYKLARRALYMLLYAPYGDTVRNANYPAMDLLRALANVEKGDGLALGRLVGIVPADAPFSCSCPGKPRLPIVVTPDAGTALMCTDSDSARSKDTVEELEEYFRRMHEDSEFADQWLHRAFCVGWKVRPVERFAGPFVGNTSFPILFIGNTADPITPLRHSHKMSRGFNNSVVLQQDSAGHCTYAATSLCVAKAIRKYFREGKLPENGTVCNVESTMFPNEAEIRSVQALSNEEREVMEAWEGMSASFVVPRPGMTY